MDLHLDIQTDRHTSTMTMSTATYWAYTLNNPDDNETALVHSLFERASHAIKSNVFQHETGAEGTPHFQGLVTLQKQQRLSFVRKLLPRAHWTPCTKAEHIENMKRYVQKRDETSEGTTTTQQSNPPVMDALSLLRKMIQESLQADGSLLSYDEWKDKDYVADYYGHKEYMEYVHERRFHDDGHYDHFKRHLKKDECSMVQEDPYNAKIFIQPAYTKLKKDYLEQIYMHERVKHYTPTDADDHTGEQQDAGRQVGWIDVAATESGSEGEEDEDGEDSSDSGEDAEDGDTESDQG